MKTLLTRTAFLSCLIACSFSCSNDIDCDINQDVESISTKAIESNDNTQLNKFIYNGKTYEYTTTTINDSVYINNPEIIDLFQKFKQSEQLITYLHKDGTIEYFTNREVYEKELPNIIKQEETLVTTFSLPYSSDIMTRGQRPLWDFTEGKIANLYLYDDTYYEDSNHMFYITSTQRDLEVPELKSYGLNDKISSLCIYSYKGITLFELYEDSDYKDDCLSITVYEDSKVVVDGVKRAELAPVGTVSFELIDLKKLSVETHIQDSWNDRISSLKIERLK